MEHHRTKDILHVQRLLGHKNIQNTLIYVDLEATLFGKSSDVFTVRIAHDVGEAAALTETGFEYITGEYNDGGKTLENINSENSYGSVKSMESLNMFKQFIGKFYLQKLR
jgi:hypothetical protein